MLTVWLLGGMSVVLVLCRLVSSPVHLRIPQEKLKAMDEDIVVQRVVTKIQVVTSSNKRKITFCFVSNIFIFVLYVHLGLCFDISYHLGGKSCHRLAKMYIDN